MTDRHVVIIANLDPVDRLLIECLRVDLPLDDNADLLDVKALCRGFSAWEEVLPRASFQGVLSWVQEVMSGLGEGIVPERTLKQLRDNRLAQTARMAGMAAGQSEILRQLHDSGIESIVLKGPFLAEYVYPSTSLRNYTDIDLLVRKRDVEAAGAIFEELGYRLIDIERGSIFGKGRTQVHYYREGLLPIDLHWDLINVPSHDSSISVDLDEIWSSARPVTLAGTPAFSLSPEDTLLFQCAHLTAHHDFNRLLWFKDVQQVIASTGGSLDWHALTERAARYHLKTFVYYSLVMTADVFGRLPLPGGIYEELAPRYMTARLFERLARRSNILELQNLKRRPALEVWRAMRDERAKRYGAIMRRTFPEVEWYLECYPFLPKIRHQKMYYCAYPALMALRLLKRPVQLDLSDTSKSR